VRQWSRVLTPGLLIVFAVAIVVLVAMLFVGLGNLRDVYGTSEAVARSYAVKAALEQLLATIVDAETGERGFVITGAETYLEPYSRARAEIAADFALVHRLTADNREQQADLDRLATLANRKLDELAKAVALRRESGFAAAQAKVADDVGRQLMNEMRTVAARMEAREDGLLAGRSAAAERSYRSAQVTRVAGIGVGLLALFGLFWGMLRYGSERLAVTRALEERQAALRESLQLKDEFVAVVAHELRTPISTIVGWSRMLGERSLKPDRVDAAIAAINRNAESLRQLIDDLMDTSQLASGRMRLTVGAVDLGQVIEEAVAAVQFSADNKGVILTARVPSDHPVLMQGDAGRLKQVVWNLLANAIKFTPAGGHVAVSVQMTDRGFRLEVTDTGSGIEPQFLPYVFERFRQGATGPRHAGVGLGLAIVRHLVELHGGTVTAQSAGPGKGATFVIELPLIPTAQVAARSAWSA
jgi:signal transduction histidine kinase